MKTKRDNKVENKRKGMSTELSKHYCSTNSNERVDKMTVMR